MTRGATNTVARTGGDLGSAGLSNRLGDEASPYLSIHAAQPVHWQPWSADAFALAEREQKPVLVSIGYLACYWCHVMSQESFSDHDIAEIMNRDFINIKVDREERPDVDRLILDAMARLGARTGWPVTAFLTPRGTVYDGGSYFPPVPRHGLPGFPDVLARAARRFCEGSLEVNSPEPIRHSATAKPAAPSAVSDIARYAHYLAARLSENVDPLYGGFGLNGPKFPQPALHELLWRIHAADNKPSLAAGVETSLANICRSALFDQLGGGFHRYCVDEAWSEPHFEKMLYDNAQLVELMTWLWRGTKAEIFAQTIEQTIEWAIRDMRVESGGFAASLGAYSGDAADTDHGGAGQFYLWSPAQLSEALGESCDLFEGFYEIRGLPGGASGPLARTEKNIGAEQRSLLAPCHAALLLRRATRPGPARDNKILADWNGLMIVALTEAGDAFGRADWNALAEATFDALAAQLGCGDKLRHCITGGRLGPAALLEDYASMARAALRLYEGSGRARYLALARRWVAVLDGQFWDAERGGYYTSGDQDWVPGERLRTITETSLPSGNAMMIGVLARLHEITGEGAFRDRAEQLVQAFRADLTRYGIAVATALNNVLSLDRFVRINVLGPDGHAAVDALLKAAQACCLPDRMVLRQQIGEPAAQICIGTTCLMPLTDPTALSRLLEPGGFAAAGFLSRP